jgi:hypothetical protein
VAIDWDALVLAPLHAAFGEGLSYQPVTGAAFTLTDAVIDRGYIHVGTDAGGVPITAWATYVGIRLASCPPGFVPADEDRVTAQGSTWRVVDEQPDGKGNTVLVLGVIAS